jgi:hypothetical protein
MSILDRVSKVVGDVVDRGKKEVDQFLAIQKINGQISDLEKSISASKGQIHEAKASIGEMAIDMLRAGTLVSPGIKELLDQITDIQQQIDSCEAEIARKKVDIENIKSESKTPKAPDSPAATQPVPPPPTPQPPPKQPEPQEQAQPQQPQQPSAIVCPKCGASVPPATFCGQCGSKPA